MAVDRWSLEVEVSSINERVLMAAIAKHAAAGL
jgi:hypothetical protein